LTIKIDETTGLAALPEDMFWRVAEATVDAGETTLHVGGTVLKLIRKKTLTKEEYESHYFEDNGFWKRLITGEKRSKITETVPAETATKEILEIQNFLVKVVMDVPKGEKGQWTPFDYEMFFYYSSNIKETKYYKVTPATPENLREKSVEAWKSYLNAEHTDALEEDRKVELNRVLGDYPPKSLKDLVDA
jgi:hypothetical protein